MRNMIGICLLMCGIIGTTTACYYREPMPGQKVPVTELNLSGLWHMEYNTAHLYYRILPISADTYVVQVFELDENKDEIITSMVYSADLVLHGDQTFLNVALMHEQYLLKNVLKKLDGDRPDQRAERESLQQEHADTGYVRPYHIARIEIQQEQMILKFMKLSIKESEKPEKQLGQEKPFWEREFKLKPVATDQVPDPLNTPIPKVIGEDIFGNLR